MANLTENAPSRGLHIALWVGQVLLALAFGMAGLMKLLAPSEMAMDAALPEALVLFIGATEVAGAVGVILPAATRIKPALTPLAAAGFVLVMVLAAGFHLSTGEAPTASVILGVLAGFVAWGRWRRAPILART